MCVKLKMAKILQIFGQLSVVSNLSGAKVSLHMVLSLFSNHWVNPWVVTPTLSASQKLTELVIYDTYKDIQEYNTFVYSVKNLVWTLMCTVFIILIIWSVCVCGNTHTYMQAYTHAPTHPGMHTPTHTHIHTNTQTEYHNELLYYLL